LIDKFHDENSYLIAIKDGDIVGMLAIRGERPFSLDQKLNDVDSYLPKGLRVCEIRLFTVKKAFRRTRIVRDLFSMVVEYCIVNNFDAAIISGLLKQVNLYKHLGFVPFGPIVGDEKAAFQPMYLSKEGFNSGKFRVFKKDYLLEKRKPMNLMAGPVNISKEVESAMMLPQISHRSEKFKELFNTTKKNLKAATNAKGVAMLFGSGTLANDVIAGELSKLDGKGVVVTNGEFGDRLISHAKFFDLEFDVCTFSEKERVTGINLRKRLKGKNGIKWIWFVHCETSTGVVNDLPAILSLSEEFNIKLCVDVISTIGVIELDLNKVYLASGVSGKGLLSYPGIAIVFYNHKIERSKVRIPKYLNLYHYIKDIPFTILSNLVKSLHRALESIEYIKLQEENSSYKLLISSQFFDSRCHFVCDESYAHPNIITIDFSDKISSLKFGNALADRGFFVAYKSKYLLKANRMQICFFGSFCQKDIQSLSSFIKYYLNEIV